MSDIQSVLNLISFLVVGCFLILTGGIAAFIALAYQNKNTIEKAFMAFPPETKELIQDAIGKLYALAAFFRDVTDEELEDEGEG